MAVRVSISIALLTYLLALAGAAIAPHAVAQPAASPPAVSEEAHPPAPIVGFSINLHHTEKIHLYHESIDQLVELGIDSLQIVTPAFTADGAAQTITIEHGPGRGPTRDQLVGLLSYAKQRGLRTALMPVVLFTKPRGNEWRGKISPEDWNAWWKSYQGMMDYFTAVAVETDVDTLAVGSELLSTEAQTDRWRTLIAHVRKSYKGQLLYSTNWDHYHVPAFWSDLNYIGISGYWDLTRKAANDPPTDEDLVKRLNDIQQSIYAFARAQGKKVIITEVGYPTLSWALKNPWNYIAGNDAKADPQVQARGYRAFLGSFGKALSPDSTQPLSGVYFYAWDPYHSGGSRDTGYGIRGKPAAVALRQWLEQRP